jgi:hypothetical protein
MTWPPPGSSLSQQAGQQISITNYGDRALNRFSTTGYCKSLLGKIEMQARLKNPWYTERCRSYLTISLLKLPNQAKVLSTIQRSR